MTFSDGDGLKRNRLQVLAKGAALGALSVFFVVCGDPATAQGYERAKPVAMRRGVWLSTGVGFGWEMSNRHDADAAWGRSGYVRMGGTPNRRFRLGGELSFRVHHRDGLVTERAIVACTGQYYPTDLAGVFLKAGIGLSVTNEDWEVIPGFVAVGGSYGLGATLGAGIDIPLIAPVSLTPNIDWFGTIGYTGESEGYSLFLFAPGITLQTK